MGAPPLICSTMASMKKTCTRSLPGDSQLVTQKNRQLEVSRKDCFLFPKQFTVRGSQCFKEWSPWCWMVWSGSRPACLPLPFICLPVLFICLPGWVIVVRFPAGLSPTSFHLSPTSFHLSPTSFQLSPSSFHLSLRLGACGRVPDWLVSHFLSFVSQPRCLWSGSRPACLPFPFICLPLKMCPPFVSLLVSAHFHWPCSISIRLSPKSVTGGVRRFPLVV